MMRDKEFQKWLERPLPLIDCFICNTKITINEYDQYGGVCKPCSNASIKINVERKHDLKECATRIDQELVNRLQGNPSMSRDDLVKLIFEEKCDYFLYMLTTIRSRNNE